MLKPQRLFRNFYHCDSCTETGSEWDDIMLTQGTSFCPCCDQEWAPYSSDELFEEFADDDEEPF